MEGKPHNTFFFIFFILGVGGWWGGGVIPYDYNCSELYGKFPGLSRLVVDVALLFL